MRLTLLAATASAVFVGVHAPSALASDGTEPVDPIELLDAELVPEIPELDAEMAPESVPVPNVEEPPIVISTAAAEDAIDVSVRVLSPGTDAPARPDSAPDGAISPAPEPDITADPAPSGAPAEPASVPASSALNTNVSIRVLSPGDNGFVSQDDLSEVASEITGNREAATPPQPDGAPAPEDRSATGNDDAQYHEENSQYQSASILLEESWVWVWYLSLDCTGVTSSISTEIGSPDSDNWAWDWTWNWDCGFDGASEAAGDAMQEGVPYTISSTSSPVPESAASHDSGQLTAEASWIWTWTFTFCGRETTISLRTQTELSFSWTWDWTWAWACTTAVTSGPDSVSSPDGPSNPATTPWPDTAAGGEGTTTEAAGSSSTLELPPPLVALLGPLFVPISIAEAVIPPAVPALASPQIPTEETEPRPRPVLPPLPIPAVSETPPLTGEGATTSPSAPEQVSTRSTRSPRDSKASPQRAHLPRLPLDTPTRRTAGTPGSSGSASSTTSGGVAALTGLYLLAAPGLGRRIRTVRELSPRDPVRAPLDRPG